MQASELLRILRLPLTAYEFKMSQPGGPTIIRALAASSLVCAMFGFEKKPPESAKKASSLPSASSAVLKKDKKETVKVDLRFWRRFFQQLKIVIPTMFGRELLYVLALTIFLLARTELTLRISAVTGRLAKTMVETNLEAFVHAILSLAAWSVPASIVNSGLKFFATLLHLRFRKNLATHLHRMYLQSRVTYHAAGLGAVDTIDQRITQDIDLWAKNAAELYTTVFKPFVDVVLFSRAVARYGGYRGPCMIVGYYGMLSFLMRVVMPNFGHLTAVQQGLEAELRTGHTRLMNFSEEVRFLNGIDIEHSGLNALYQSLQSHVMYVARHRARMGVFEGIMVKYGSVMVGYAVCAMSMFSKEAENDNEAALTGLYMENSQLLSNLARAVGQIIMAYKKLTALAGYTARVSELLEQVDAVRDTIKKKGSSASAGGVYRRSHRIAFDRVPIIPPDGSVLVKGLSFYVEKGMNLLILGPNGCGKSSSFRLLGELWVPQGGMIEKPEQSHMYYVPQRPYMCQGTLLEQVIYPLSAADNSIPEARLLECMERAGLRQLMARQNLTWDTEQDWSREVLSQGDKQKMAMARLYFHRPKYAILDECSSAVDLEQEAKLYQNCSDLSIAVITVAHRRSVWKYHNWCLKFDGDGGFVFSPMKLEDDGTLILTNIKMAQDPALVGKSMMVDPSTAIAQVRVVEEKH